MIFLQGIFTTTIDFVTWPPFYTIWHYKSKGGQVTKVNHSCENALSSWPSLISDVLVVYNFASDWPRTFFTARLFLFS